MSYFYPVTALLDCMKALKIVTAKIDEGLNEKVSGGCLNAWPELLHGTNRFRGV